METKLPALDTTFSAMKSSPNLLVGVGRVMLTGGVEINVISNILRDIDLHKGGTHHSNRSESTICVKQGINLILGVYNLIRL